MKRDWWTPDIDWTSSDAIIIGGGASLSGFDWTLLHGRNTIGINYAFRLGAQVCKICFFSDPKWYDQAFKELTRYTGVVVSHSPRLTVRPDLPSWVKLIARMRRGLHPLCLGFGGNSGPGAVNLALILGAHRVFLLGFDCKLVEGKSHWHSFYNRPIQRKGLYADFMEGWQYVKQDLPKVFPGREIINIGPDSELPFFPKQDWREVLLRTSFLRVEMAV